MSGVKSLPTLGGNKNRSLFMEESLVCANIGNEIAWEHRHKPSYTPPRVVLQMRRDLWALPLWVTPSSCPVFAPEQHAPLPAFLSREHGDRVCSPLHWGRWKPSSIALWGPEPTLLRQMQRYSVFREKSFEYGGGYETLDFCMNRSASQRFFLSYNTIATDAFACVVYQKEELSRLLGRAPLGLVLKKPYSSSGRGVFFVTKERASEAEKLLQKAPLLVEPLLNKQQDWAAEYYISPGGVVSFCGLSFFATSPNGQYLYNELLSQEMLIRRLQCSVGAALWQETQTAHIRFLQQEVAPNYTGYVGIDMLTYTPFSSKEISLLHPFVEINLRYTMGMYALDLYRIFGVQGRFSIQMLPLEEDQRRLFVAKLSEHPPQWSNEGRWLGGVLPLTLPDAESRYIALLCAT